MSIDTDVAAAAMLRARGWTVTAPALAAPNAVKHGCFCDLFSMEVGTEPNGCVIDINRHADCFYAKKGMVKESCSEWKPWTQESLIEFWARMATES